MFRSFWFGLCWLFCAVSAVDAQITISGKVVDSNNEPLPYCNIFIKETQSVAVSNELGLYKIQVNPGTYTLVFQYIGFTKLEKQIEAISSPIILDVQLNEELTDLEAVVIGSDKEDYAYTVIRKAIEMRKIHLEEVSGYACSVYMKGLQKLVEAPDQIMGIQLNTILDVDSNNTGIVYLSESSSTFYFQQPNSTKEIMHASKVSGNNSGFSWNDASGMQMNFYENLETLEGFSQRGFISPIADNALFFYKYHLLGQVSSNGRNIYKIEVTPKRKTDPAYTGIIYITDFGYRISGLQLMLTKENGVEFLDTFRVEQEYFYTDPDHLVLLTTKFSFTYDFFSVRGNGYFHAHYSNYELNPKFEEDFFGGEVTKIEAGANKQDSAFWENNRPMQLTLEEQADYAQKEALAIKKETRAWQDSADHEFNKFKFGQLITGYDYRKSRLHITASTNPIFDLLQFNTIEGYVVQPRIQVRYNPNDSITWEYGAVVRYGSATDGCFISGNIGLRFDPFHRGRANLQGGSGLRQYNRDGIMPLFNTAYSLLLEENYLQAYGQDFIQLDVERELFTNGLYLKSGLLYANRFRMTNAPELAPWIAYEKTFEDNNTFQTADETITYLTPIPDIISASVGARYVIKQTYISHPTEKFVLSPKYPIIEARLQFTFSPDSMNRYHNTICDLTVQDDITLKLAGSVHYAFRYAKQFSTGEPDIADQLHAAGNATIFSRLTETGFLVLPYYAATTDRYMTSAHVQWHLDGFLFRKLPLFKQLRMDPVFTLNTLHSAEIPLYVECAAGVEHLFNVMRIDAAFVPFAGEIDALVPPFRLLIGFGF